jgi:hypothetical protein
MFSTARGQWSFRCNGDRTAIALTCVVAVGTCKLSRYIDRREDPPLTMTTPGREYGNDPYFVLENVRSRVTTHNVSTLARLLHSEHRTKAHHDRARAGVYRLGSDEYCFYAGGS